jgi:hypothetical protein
LPEVAWSVPVRRSVHAGITSLMESPAVWRVAASGGGVSLVCSAAAWLSLLAWRLGADWSFVPAFLLLGATGFIVGVIATLIERTTVAYMALLIGGAAPLSFLIWLSHLEPDAFS